jgi:two-component system, OmpR family, sensor histidine kinase MprB
VSLRARLTLVSAAAVAAAVALAALLGWLIVRDQLREQLDATLQDRAAEVIVETGPEGQRAIRLPAAPFGAARGYAQLVPADGAIELLPGESEPLPISEEAREVAAGGREAFFSNEEADGTSLRVLTQQVAPGLAVQVALPLEETSSVLRRLAFLLGLVGVGGIALAAALGLVVARASLAPVRAVTETAEHVAETRDLTRRIEAGGADELARLARAFNTMLAALERSLAAQRQLVADASHELRTPITSLRTNIEVLARDGVPAEERQRILGDLVGQLEELSVLVGDVVDLARGAEPEALVEAVRLDLLVAEAVARARTHAPTIRFETDLAPTLVRGVPARLDRAVANLLDNAAKWSPMGGTVHVSVGDGVVTVRDEGPGIADVDLPHVFDRFYRAPGARSLPGSGLGLAIVRQVAESHGGTAVAERAASGGAQFRLSLPPPPKF